MKTNKIFLGILMCSAIGLTTSCLSETKDLEPRSVPEEKETGRLVLDLNADANFAFETRAVDENTYKNTDNYTVNITDNKGVSKFSGTFATLQTRLPLELDLGSYSITASYGTEQAASRDNFLATGSNTFTISGGNTTSTTVNCTPTAGKVLVEFDSSMDTYCDTYSVDFSGTAALGTSVAHWGKTDTAPYYLAISEAGETVSYTIHITTKDDYAGLNGEDKVTNATATGSFTLQRNKAKKLTIRPNYTPTTEGGLKIEVTIDDSTNDIPIEIEVPVTWI
ncbi:MAG: DUF4493 domain-containing protein [Bacteroidaceae bacterium]|nr:DUF4493 domain-containing protein [Bacteroidaceae bacterium]